MQKISLAELKRIQSSGEGRSRPTLDDHVDFRGKQYTAAKIAFSFWTVFEAKLLEDPNMTKLSLSYSGYSLYDGTDHVMIGHDIIEHCPFNDECKISTTLDNDGTVHVTVEVSK